MQLYINGQDIHELILGRAKDGVVTQMQAFPCAPEAFLKTLQAFLHSEGVSLEELSEIFIVSGPGSATALRASLSIINSIAFTRDIAVRSIEKGPREQDQDAFVMALNTQNPTVGRFVYPIYLNEAQITFSTRDTLGRKKKVEYK